MKTEMLLKIINNIGLWLMIVSFFFWVIETIVLKDYISLTLVVGIIGTIITVISDLWINKTRERTIISI